MRYFFFMMVVSVLMILQGCSPTFNWRDVHPAQTPLIALFPCKPDQDARMVSLAAKEVTLTMLACDAGGATFALAYADMQDIANTGVALGQWKSATLATMRGHVSSELPFVLHGASVLPPSVQVQARGTRPDGAPVALQAVWFVVGSQVFQAAVYADPVSPAVAEAYFAGLRLP